MAGNAQTHEQSLENGAPSVDALLGCLGHECGVLEFDYHYLCGYKNYPRIVQSCVQG